MSRLGRCLPQEDRASDTFKVVQTIIVTVDIERVAFTFFNNAVIV